MGGGGGGQEGGRGEPESVIGSRHCSKIRLFGQVFRLMMEHGTSDYQADVLMTAPRTSPTCGVVNEKDTG